MPMSSPQITKMFGWSAILAPPRLRVAATSRLQSPDNHRRPSWRPRMADRVHMSFLGLRAGSVRDRGLRGVADRTVQRWYTVGARVLPAPQRLPTWVLDQRIADGGHREAEDQGHHQDHRH